MIRTHRSWHLGPILLLLASLAACDRLLDVDSPSRIPAETLENPANAQLLVNSTISDFECAFGAYVVLGGLIGEELDDATQTADRYPYDQRLVLPSDRRYSVFACENLGVYTPLQTARASADNVLGFLSGWTDAEVPNRSSLIATASAFSGYSMLLLAEGFCSSTITTLDANHNPVYGSELTRAEMFARAEARFTEAIAAAQTANNTAILNLARVGRARARLNLANYAGAKADAELVPAGFVYEASATDINSRRQNRVWSENSDLNTSTSVGAPYRSLNDPRVPVTNTGNTSVTGVPLYEQGKYPAATTPIPIARYEEAQLIIAEADARANDLGGANAIIAVFRTRGGQGPFVGVDQQSVLNEIIDQRRRELFLEGQHVGDVIRYNLTLTPAPGAPYPGGGTYGPAGGSGRCLPLPDVERLNNPNLRS
jgi:starch-binding outer membrane protein, SusD/RagB family